MMTDELCGWFAACPNRAVAIVNHPILGDVPICIRCVSVVFKDAGDIIKKRVDEYKRRASWNW
jgi:hypothetical protein